MRLDVSNRIASTVVFALSVLGHALSTLPLRAAEEVPGLQQRGQVIDAGVADLTRVGLAKKATAIVVFGADCSACVESMDFYRRLLAMPEMDGEARKLVVISKGGVIPVKRILDSHRFEPHRLTSGPGGRIEGITDPPAVIVLDPAGKRRGTWTGRLTPAQEAEVVAAIGGK